MRTIGQKVNATDVLLTDCIEDTQTWITWEQWEVIIGKRGDEDEVVECEPKTAKQRSSNTYALRYDMNTRDILEAIDNLQVWFAAKPYGWRERATPDLLQQASDREAELDHLVRRLELSGLGELLSKPEPISM